MTRTHKPISRIARSLTPRRVLPLAVLFVIADLAITVALLGLAVENNPVAAWLFESVGTTSTGVVSVVLITLAYVGLDELDGYDRSRRLVAGGLLAITVAPVVWNTAIYVRLGSPELALGHVLEPIAPVAVAGVVAVLATSVDVDVRDLPRPEREAVVSVALSVLMVTSMVGGVAFIGTQPLTEEQTGAVSAAEEDLTYTASDDGTVKAINQTGTVVWTYSGYSTQVEGMDISADGKTLYAGGGAGNIVGIDADTGEEVWRADGIHGSPIKGLAVNPENGVIYTGAEDNSVKATDQTGTILWTFGGHSDWIKRVDVSHDGSMVYSLSESDGALYGLNASTGNSEWSQSFAGYGGSVVASSVNNDLYAGDSDTVVKKIDGNTGNTDWSTTVSGSGINSLGISPDNSQLIVGAHNNADQRTTALNADNGSEEWFKGTDEGLGTGAHASGYSPDGSVIYLGGGYGGFHVYDPADGSQLRSSSPHGNTINQISGGSFFASSGSTRPDVRVTDTNGDPVEDATVEAYRADEEAIKTQLGSEIDSAEEEADRLMDEAADPVPDSFEDVSLSVGDMDPIYPDGEASGVYPTAHTKADMGLEGYVDSPELTPRLKYDSGESVYLYAWDPSDGDNLGLTEDGVTRQHVGSVDSDATFTITKIDAYGDDLETREINASETYAGGAWPATFEHDFAKTRLPDGYYRVSVKGSEAPGYVIEVGDAADLLETQLKDDAGAVSDRAADLQSNLDDGLFTRQTGVTNETGVPPNLTLPSGEVAVQAYKGPDPSFFNKDDPSQITASDLRTAYEAGYEGAVYIPTRATRANTKNLGENDTVRVEVRKVSVGQLSDMDKYESLFDSLLEERLNETVSDLEDMYRDDASNLTELEDRHAELKKLVENNEELESRVEELLGRELNGETEAELRAELDAMQTAIADHGETLESGEPESEISDGEVFAKFPFSGELDADAVTVISHYEDGSSDVVDEEYVSVESSSVLGGDEVVIDGYPVPAERAVADLEVMGVSEEGDLGSSRDSVRNPLFSGDVPEVDAIDVSTLRPGVGDQVSMSVRSSDSAFNGTSGATVYGPNGNEVAVTKDADRLRWTPETAGDHTVRISYTNTIGHTFVETFRLEVRERSTTTPPSLRVTDGIGGKLVLAGDGLESGSVELVDGTAEITARAPGGETPSSVSIWAESLSEETIDVSVVQGDYDKSVDKHVSLTIRSNADVEDAIVRRSGNAIAADGSGKHGSYEKRTDKNGNEVTVIETYTDASGVATVEINNDPSLLERIQYRIETISVVPATLGVPTGTPEVLSTAALDAAPMLNEATPGELVSSTEVGE